MLDSAYSVINNELNRVRDERDALKLAVERVKSLHKMIDSEYGNQVCAHCTWDEDVYVEYPCKTVVALDKQ
jgi:hypothetical protein